MIEMEEMKFSICSNCFNPKSGCCQRLGCRNYSGKDETRTIQIPKVSGRYYTEYFDDEEQEEKGKIMRSNEIKKFFYSCIIKNEQYKIKRCFESLERIFKIYRDGKPHNTECEYAVGRCYCECGEKYHGLRGQGAEKRYI